MKAMTHWAKKRVAANLMTVRQSSKNKVVLKKCVGSSSVESPRTNINTNKSKKAVMTPFLKAPKIWARATKKSFRLISELGLVKISVKSWFRGSTSGEKRSVWLTSRSGRIKRRSDGEKRKSSLKTRSSKIRSRARCLRKRFSRWMPRRDDRRPILICLLMTKMTLGTLEILVRETWDSLES